MDKNKNTDQKVVLIIGGYGVFGGRLAMALTKDARMDVIVAGRSLEKAQAFCDINGGRACELDTNASDIEQQITDLDPFLVIDAAGPFQAYGNDPYRIATAAINCKAHYLDLSDDGAFTAGIAGLNDAAIDANVMVLSGVSSVPALSSSAVVSLSKGMGKIDLIESVILPGNRAPRGISVIHAILAQVGRPMKVWRDGQFETSYGWSKLRREALKISGIPPVGKRRSSLIGAPDLTLFPKYFNAQTVEFRAGLDLGIMHWGLMGLGWLVRLRLMRSAVPLANILKWIADRLEPFGSDRGGMRVRVVGQMESGQVIQKDWVLIAEAGDGPHIPAIPARVLSKRIVSGQIKVGARPCLGEFLLSAAEGEMRDLNAASASSTTPT